MSLRLRLALWYGVLTGTSIFLVATFAYALHSRALYDNLDRSLQGTVEHVRGLDTSSSLAADLTAMLATPVLPNVGIRVYDHAAKLLALSPNAMVAPDVDPHQILAQPAEPAYDRLASLMPSLPSVPESEGVFGLLHDADGRRWRLYVVALEEKHQYLVAEASLGEIDASVGMLRRLIPLLTLAGATVTLLAGLGLAGSALRPVALLTETAASITRASELGRRLPGSERLDELGHMALTFNEMLASIEDAYHAQQRFVADASHELRAPLTAIQGNLELLKRQPNMPVTEQQEAVEEAHREATRLSRLVDDLLALARADAGQDLARRTVELDALVLQTLASARQLARGQSLELGEFEPVEVEGDPDRLRQLLLILMDNAIKYTPRTGVITLALHALPNCAELIVVDNGVGIPAADLPHVFERFYRADPARGRDPGGAGLGLAIASWIVDQHKGTIQVQSKVGHGSRITVRLPHRRFPTVQ